MAHELPSLLPTLCRPSRIHNALPLPLRLQARQVAKEQGRPTWERQRVLEKKLQAAESKTSRMREWFDTQLQEQPVCGVSGCVLWEAGRDGS